MRGEVVWRKEEGWSREEEGIRRGRGVTWGMRGEVVWRKEEGWSREEERKEGRRRGDEEERR